MSFNVPAAFDVRAISDGDRAVLLLEGEFDFSVAPRARAALEGSSPDARTLIIDLRGLTFMDSSGIHLLIEAREHCRASGRTLLVVRGNARVHRGLVALGLEDALKFVDEPLVPA